MLTLLAASWIAIEASHQLAAFVTRCGFGAAVDSLGQSEYDAYGAFRTAAIFRFVAAVHSFIWWSGGRWNAPSPHIVAAALTLRY